MTARVYNFKMNHYRIMREIEEEKKKKEMARVLRSIELLLKKIVNK